MKRPTTYIMHLIAAMLFVTALFSVAASAVGPVVNARVYDGRPASLTIVSPKANEVIGSSPVSVQGTIHNISQIMVYVDDVYSITYPVDSGSATYALDASVSMGRHTLKLVAINPFDGTTIEEQVSFVYTPVSEATVSPTTHVIEQAASTATGATEYMNDQVAQAAQTEPAAGLSNAAYDVMQALDLVPPPGSTETIARTTGRFAAVVTGTVLLVFTQPIFWLYHVVRYQFMQWNIHAFPLLVRHHSIWALRLLGVGLFVSAFLF